MDRARPIRVMIIDDNYMLCAALRRVCQSAPDLELLGFFPTAVAMNTEAARAKPDVLLIDLDLPDGDSLGALPQFRAASPGSRVVVLSGHCSREYVQRALAAGVDGYLSKGDAPKELIERVRAAWRGERVFSADVRMVMDRSQA